MTTFDPFTMFDAVDIDNIPKDAPIVAGYVGGQWPTFRQLAARFPHALRVSIAVTAEENAHVLDVENGDATVFDVPSWVIRQRKRGTTPIIYTTASNWAKIVQLCSAYPIDLPRWWAADWTNTLHIPLGAVACQWANGSGAYPGLAPHCDTSVVTDAFLQALRPQPKGNTVNINGPSKAQLNTLVHELGGLAAVVTAVEKSGTLPASVRAVIAAGGAFVVALERFFTRKSS